MTETALTTALNVSYMAERLAVFGLVVGIALLLTGIGLVILAFAVFGREREPESSVAPVVGHARDGLIRRRTTGGTPDRTDAPPPGAQRGRVRPPSLFP